MGEPGSAVARPLTGLAMADLISTTGTEMTAVALPWFVLTTTGSPARMGIVLAAERYDGPEPVNVGSGQEITIRELTERIAALTGFTGDLLWDERQPDGQPRRRLDTSRARDRFDFEASTPLEDGLRRTIDWFRAQPRDPGARAAALR